ncbi:MAG TPA: apolipoprotein N-acyltransferase [Kineosporiaceae bacterium]|nr:apolipoprotein N-acyltransferase [Kineosporiaceae bacterium]
MSTPAVAAPESVRSRWLPGPEAPGPALRLPVALLVAVAGGVALMSAFPGTGWWPLAPVGVAAVSVATHGRTLRQGALVGLVGGLGFFLPHLHWSGIYVGQLPWLALAGLETSFVVLLGALLPLSWHVPGGRVGTVLATAGLWVGEEAVRGRVPFGGFPWGRLAFSQADAPTLGYAALGGSPLVGAVVAAAGGCLAVAAVDVLLGRTLRRTLTAGLGRVLVAVALLGGGGLVPRPVGASGTAQVAAVQGNVPKPGLDFNARRMAVLGNHVTATDELANQVAAGRVPQPEIVLWPENASDIDPLRDPEAATAVQSAVDRIRVPVLVGAVLEQPAGHLSNAGILWAPSTAAQPGPGAMYLKRHPAPFGEYIPYRSFFRTFSDKVDLVREDFAPGSRTAVLPSGKIRIGDVICFEVAYDSLVRDPVREGANLLVVQTNNATFGYTDESVQQLAMSRLRAVETGRAVVHISTVGVSALIAPDGRVITRSGHFTQQVLQARLPLRTDLTLATRLGGSPEVVLAAIGLLLVVAGLVRRRRVTRTVLSHPADAPSGSPARTPDGGAA